MNVLHNIDACFDHAANKCVQQRTQSLHHFVKYPELAGIWQQTACCAGHLIKSQGTQYRPMMQEVSISSAATVTPYLMYACGAGTSHSYLSGYF